jgi:hypothetical protein
MLTNGTAWIIHRLAQPYIPHYTGIIRLGGFPRLGKKLVSPYLQKKKKKPRNYGVCYTGGMNRRMLF